MTLLTILVFKLIFTASQLTVDIIYSSFTDLDFAENLTALVINNLQDEFEFNLVDFESLWNGNQLINSPDIIFDLTFSASFSELIKKSAEEKKILIASIDKGPGTLSNWEFFLHNSWKSQIEALYGIVSYFKWQTFIVISEEINNEYNEVFSYYFSNENFLWFFFSSSNNENSADLFIGKVIQPTGIRNIVILNQGESTNSLLKALERKNFFTGGTGIIVGSKGSWGLYGNGVVSYTESGLESADSYYSYEGLAFIKFLKIILSLDISSGSLSLFQRLNIYYNQQVENPKGIENLVINDSNLKADCLIKNLCSIDNRPISNFTMLNIKNNQKLISGNIFKGNLTILNPLTHPGNSTIIPNSPFTSINIWYDNQLGLGPANLYALHYWKSIHLLDGFEITSTSLICIGSTYDQNFTYNCFSHALTSSPVGFITSVNSQISIAYVYILRSLNCSIPNISPYAPSSITQNKTTFPEFMTVAKDINFNGQVILDLAKVFGWNEFIVVYDEQNEEYSKYFIYLAGQFNMKIANSPDVQKINLNYTVDKYSEWKDWFEEILSLKVRLYVIFLSTPSWIYIIESFYDAGLRRGDAIFLSNARLAYAYSLERDASQLNKLIELLYGAVVVYQAEWVGEYGKELENGFLKEHGGGSTVFHCFPFDATMLLLYGIEFTINKGQNVKDSLELNKIIRKQKFLGCSGTVSIEPDGNQRSLPTIGIYNLRWDNKTHFLYEQLVGIYDSSRLQLITLYSSVIWYDNTTITPSDSVVYENGCPFPKRNISHSSKGVNVLYGISAAIITLTIIESFVIWKKLWNKIYIEKLVVSVYIHFEDYFIMGILAIDALQFISQGSDISDLYVWLSKACSYSMAHFDYSVKGEVYWGYLYSAMIISCYWIFSTFILLFKLNKIDSFILRNAWNISLFLLPIIVNILFMPMISILLSIFQCDEGIGSNISDSFIKNDCTVHCWNHEYALWATFSLISLIVFIPSAIYFRYFYENINSHINIKTKPSFIIKKAIFQVIIAVMNKTIKIYDEALHGLCCNILLFILILLCFKNNPYNYSRMNFWLVISYLAVLWSFTLSSFYWFTKFDPWIMWILLQYLVWLILIVAGIIIQWKSIPSLLSTDKTIDIAIFFRFSMGGKISPEEINKMKKEIVENKCLSSDKKTFTINYDEQMILVSN